eukprot:TRINITY_DN5964_c0_g1_i1.p14 TRINITY_DN5964_c0_g1~~TRINITY_DN5964_c0_g1_i1.p14  ORF type:complete len:132 (-),score=0.88 TRINITY_DN5964_c0_g1_i1:1436-1831(-)
MKCTQKTVPEKIKVDFTTKHRIQKYHILSFKWHPYYPTQIPPGLIYKTVNLRFSSQHFFDQAFKHNLIFQISLAILKLQILIKIAEKCLILEEQKTLLRKNLSIVSFAFETTASINITHQLHQNQKLMLGK